MRDQVESLPFLAARMGRGARRPSGKAAAAGIIILVSAAVFFAACGGSSGSSTGGGTTPPPMPAIQNINNATTPSSPINVPIQINGSGFQSAPGTVVFSQSSSGITATVTPSAAGWTNSGIVVKVPDGDGSNNFTVPGSVAVKVTTSAGSSSEVTLNLAQTLSFNANNLTWATTTPLPTALGGLGAVAVPVSDTSAFVVVAGGYNRVNNLRAVLCNTLAPMARWAQAGPRSLRISFPPPAPTRPWWKPILETRRFPPARALSTFSGDKPTPADAPGGTADRLYGQCQHQ